MHEQRKLFILVFLWTCLCLVILKSNLLASSSSKQQQQDDAAASAAAASLASSRAEKLFARSAQKPQLSSLYLGSELEPSGSSSSVSHSNSYPFSLSSSPVSAIQEDESNQVKNQDHKAEEEKQLISEKKQVNDEKKVTSKRKMKLPESECHYKYPNLLDLQFNNVYWQKMTNSQNSSANHPALYYLYNAYYDDRWRAGLPSVRVLAMIDRIQPPPTNCLLWSDLLRDLDGEQQQQPSTGSSSKLIPLVTRAQFVYAWYPKWGNYKDGFLQPWIVTCPIPRAHLGLVPDSVSLVQVPEEIHSARRREAQSRRKRNGIDSSIAMPASFSSSSPSVQHSQKQSQLLATSVGQSQSQEKLQPKKLYNCAKTLPITNNLPVFNRRPKKKEKFAVCVKGLDFPHEDVSVRLVEWIELLNLLGASKIFLYNLDVHENVTKVLHYYERRGMVELTQLTLPGDQPNLPEYQHLYLKSKLTTKRQNELIPYNDCLYRNLNSYQYLALLDIDEIIMPLRHRTWHELMNEVESLSLAEQNYSRASYNVRNVYFFDDLAGPLGTTSSSSEGALDSDYSEQGNEQDQKSNLERGIPHYLHMMQHVYRSKNYTKPGQYVKCFHNTERVVSLHNHFPMNCFGQCTTFSVPLLLAHLQHYRKDCVGPLKQSCKNDFRVFTQRDTTIWKYKQQMIKRTTRVLSHLNLIATSHSKPSTDIR